MPACRCPGTSLATPVSLRAFWNWQAVSGDRPVTRADFVRSTSQGLEISGRDVPTLGGVRQRLDVDVANARALIPRPDSKVGEAGGG